MLVERYFGTVQGCQLPKTYYFLIFCQKLMKLKEFKPLEARVPGAPLYLPMQSVTIFSETYKAGARSCDSHFRGRSTRTLECGSSHNVEIRMSLLLANQEGKVFTAVCYCGRGSPLERDPQIETPYTLTPLPRQ